LSTKLLALIMDSIMFNRNPTRRLCKNLINFVQQSDFAGSSCLSARHALDQAVAIVQGLGSRRCWSTDSVALGSGREGQTGSDCPPVPRTPAA